MKNDLQPVMLSAYDRRERIRESAVDSLKSVFPIVGNKYRVEAKNIHVEESNFTPEDYKKAVLQARTLAEPIRADLEIRDNKNKIVSKAPNFTLLRLPHLTSHDAFILNGNPVSVAHQLRLRPGVYTRKRRDEGVEADFKLTKGNPFRMRMDPQTGTFTMEYGSTVIPLYAALQAMGVPDKQIARAWNKDLLTANREAAGNIDRQVDKLYRAAVPDYQKEEGQNKRKAIYDALMRTVLDPKVTARTLGKELTTVSPETLLAASKKILQVYQDDVDYDERDSLAFKHLKSIEDFVGERIGLDARQLNYKVGIKLNRAGDSPELEKIIPPSPFTKGILSFLSTSALAENPSQINPLEALDHAVRVTSLGEGGIGNERAVPLETRRLHPTHLGVLDPVRTPESAKAGIDLRLTINAMRDKEGNLYVPVDTRKGDLEYKTVYDLEKTPVAFPDQDWSAPKIDVMHEGRIRSMPRGQVKYRIPSPHGVYSPLTNLVPFLDSVDGMRATMGAKFMSQALPLKDSEAPLVQVASDDPNESMEKIIGGMMSVRSPISGVVTGIKDGQIIIRPKRGKTAAEKAVVNFFQNMPQATKTYLNEELKVKEGDEVKAGQIVAEGAYAKDGVVSVGKNLRVAYMPMRSLNTNDAVVVSESAAKKLTSVHMTREGLDLDADTEAAREKHKAHFGNQYTRAQYDNLDAGGLIKPGAVVTKGDLLVSAVKKTTLSPESAMLGKLHKSLVRPFKDASLTWENDRPGTVVDVVRTGDKIRLTVKYEDPVEVGSKISNRFGNKGVVASILPDDQMPHDEQKRPMDVVLSSTSIVSRVNPGQLLEVAAGKVAEKTGKPILIENFAPRDNVKFVKDLLKQHGVKDTETVYDPQTRKRIPGVLTGPSYILKLMKTVDTQYSARGIEDYDVNEQPMTGGEEGSKGFGRMELNALLAHNARGILHDAAALKSQRNDDYWRAYQLGLPPPALKSPFAYDKFGAMLGGAGVKMDKSGNRVGLSPLTDKEILEMSSGEIKEPKFVRAKDLRPEKGGLFDPTITGGPIGRKWSHATLSEPIVNPVFERPVRTLLGLTGNEFLELQKNVGGAEIKKRLNEIDPDSREKDVLEALKKARADKRDDLVKELKYIRGLKETGLKPGDAYVLSHIPIVPPVFRPIIPGKTGDLRISDANLLYQDALLANDALKKSHGLPEEMQHEARKTLYDATSALFGLREPINPRSAARDVQGFLSRIAGTNPKYGFFHSKVIRKQQDLSGRGAVIPDPTLGMDEVGIPEEMGWKMYSPFLIRQLVTRGYGAVDAKKLVEDQSPVARDLLLQEAKNRPVLINRAPTLHKYNIMAAYPRFISGKAVKVPEMFAPLQNMDFDGDAVQVHVPVSNKAVTEAKGMTLSNMVLGDRTKDTLLVAPDQEAVLGLFQATAPAKGKVVRFDSLEDARAAYNRGEIALNTPVEIKK